MWLVMTNTDMDHAVPIQTSNSPLSNLSSTPKPPYDYQQHTLSFADHIYQRGLLDGVGSDMTVCIPAWQQSYRLHKLILDQNPYFQALICGGFKESRLDRQEAITLHFEDYPFITADSFDLVLTSLYGKAWDPLAIGTSNVCERLATCSFFRMDSLSEMCVVFMLETLSEATIVDYLCFADANVVHGSHRLCEGIFAFLCREAWDLPFSLLNKLPISWIQKLIQSDAFWTPTEFQRYCWLREIIFQRSEDSKDDPTADDQDLFQCLFQNHIHYMHMTFDQLSIVKLDVNPFDDKPLVPDEVIKDALWHQIQLRSIIEGADPNTRRLDLTVDTLVSSKSPTLPSSASTLQSQPSPPVLFGSSSSSTSSSIKEPDSESFVQQKQVYSIPAHDAIGYIPISHCLPNLIPPYSQYPPFRFSVEFQNLALKLQQRIYSKPVFYAGSMWNVYIQKSKSQRKDHGTQLGVYLHRQAISDHQNSDLKQYSDHQNSDLKQYIDRRQVTKTWFKIYSSTPKHTFTICQSVPDNFSNLQSWGWRSSILCYQGTMPMPSTVDNLNQALGHVSLSSSPDTPHQIYALRFSVVMGHV
ncbi:hypothetical protein DM01DRAFT_1342693 [Hesseltinella vesiculosa]|uniref:BTB domain-containing protein n=1 Tax=Hesseltinella vesiculosa TaxID=101127 RepID=A0A1X2GUQ1_9FUNG|nr:hypothetical protein DM01DRAFT_1342693 [Hesseltinella vesiculosa]